MPMTLEDSPSGPHLGEPLRCRTSCSNTLHYPLQSVLVGPSLYGSQFELILYWQSEYWKPTSYQQETGSDSKKPQNHPLGINFPPPQVLLLARSFVYRRVLQYTSCSSSSRRICPSQGLLGSQLLSSSKPHERQPPQCTTFLSSILAYMQ